MTSTPRRVAQLYLDLVNLRDLDRLVELFSPEAVVLHPVGVFEGHEAIRGFYADSVFPHAPEVEGVSLVENGPFVVFEMEARTPNGVGHLIDHLSANDDGKITRLAIYYR